METRDFKTMFAEVATSRGFVAGGGGWYRELLMGLFILALQKSNLGEYFELNLKLFLNRTVPKDAASLKKMTKSMSGDIFRRQPEQYRRAFDLGSDINMIERKRLLEELFDKVVDQIAAGADAPSGLLRLREQGVIFLLPSVEAQLKAS